MIPAFGSGVYWGIGLMLLSFFCLAVTAFNDRARDSEAFKILAAAIVVSALLEFSSFVQSTITRQQIHELGIEGSYGGAGNE